MVLEHLPFFAELSVFFRNPHRTFHLREVAKLSGLPPSTAKRYADVLSGDGLLVEKRSGRMRLFRANMSSPVFRHLKIVRSLEEIQISGITEHLSENIQGVFSIVVFGSVAKGEDDEGSDLDLLVIGRKPRRLDLHGFESKLKREVSPTVLKWSEWKKKCREDRAFYTEVLASGIPLYGELPVVE